MNNLRDIFTPVIEVAVQKYGAEYTEIRGQELSKTMITIKEERSTGNAFQLLMKRSELANNERKIGQLVALSVLVEDVKVEGK